MHILILASFSPFPYTHFLRFMLIYLCLCTYIYNNLNRFDMRCGEIQKRIMGTNSKNYHDQRTFNNTSPSNKQKYTNGSQRPSPSKSINIRTPNKNTNNGNVAGYNNRNNYFNNNNNTRLSLSGSPTTSYFAASKCFESPSPDSLPRPPATWMTGSIKNTDDSTITSSATTPKSQAQRARKSLVMPSTTPSKNFAGISQNSCAMEYAAAFSDNTNDHFTQSLKLLLNVNA